MTDVRSQTSEFEKVERTIMIKNIILFALCCLLLAPCSASAQQPTKIPRIGYLTGATRDGQLTRIEAFRQGLRELGYVEGNNIVIEFHYAELRPERRSELAAELVRLKVDVIVTSGVNITRAAKEATSLDSNCDDASWRSCWKRVGRQSGATRRQRHGTFQSRPRDNGKTIGGSERDHS